MIAALLLAAPSMAQGGYGYGYGANVPSSAPAAPLEYASEPESDSSIELPPTGYPYNLQLLATRHFDFLVWPVIKPAPGSMDDTSISLGEYARRLRAEKQEAAKPAPAHPGAMAEPSEAH